MAELTSLHGLTFGATHLGTMGALAQLAPDGARLYRGDLDEKRATIRMRSRCRGVGQDARVD